MDSHTKNAFIYATIVAMGGFVFGLDAALISGGVDLIQAEFELTPEQLGVAVASPALGVLLALPFASLVCNWFGRKKAIVVIAILYLLSAIVSAVAPNYWTLVAARFLGGVGWSSITLASMYIGEIAPPRWRGKLVSMTQINIVVGLSGAYFISYLIYYLAGNGVPPVDSLGLTTASSWRWMLAAEVPVCLIWLGLVLIIPESPYWLIHQERVDDATDCLRKIMPEGAIAAHVAEVRESLRESSESHSIVSQLVEIFGKAMRPAFVIALTIAIAQQSTGINAVLFYAQTIFKQLGIGENAAFVQAIWVGLTSVVFTVLGLLLVDKLGRRPMIIWGMVWIILSLGLCAYSFHNARYTLPKSALKSLNDIPNAASLSSLAETPFLSDIAFRKELQEVLGEEETTKHFNKFLEAAITIDARLVLLGILSFIAAFHFSVGPVMWVLFSELFPASVRGTAIPFFAVITSLTSWIVQLSFPKLLKVMGMRDIFLLYAVTVAVGLLILFLTLIETKKLTIEEVQAKLATS